MAETATKEGRQNLFKKIFNIGKRIATDDYARQQFVSSTYNPMQVVLAHAAGEGFEEVASGVCSTSYLCRIENAQVEVDDLFFEHLFEKLEISYEDVKEQNKNNDIIKYYFSDTADRYSIQVASMEQEYGAHKKKEESE